MPYFRLHEKGWRRRHYGPRCRHYGPDHGGDQASMGIGSYLIFSSLTSIQGSTTYSLCLVAPDGAPATVRDITEAQAIARSSSPRRSRWPRSVTDRGSCLLPISSGYGDSVPIGKTANPKTFVLQVENGRTPLLSSTGTCSRHGGLPISRYSLARGFVSSEC